jgi:predicted O-linked N-acetylglucosamine transferase (SPINDLY family)
MNRTQRLLQEAFEDFNNHRFSIAKNKLQNIIRGGSNEPLAFQLMAFIFLSENDNNSAIVYLKKYLNIFPNEFSTNFNLAEALFNSGNIAESNVYFQKIIELYPDNLNVYLNFSRNLSKIGDKEKALQILDKSIVINSNFVQAYFNKAKIYHEINNFDLCISTLLLAVKIDQNLFEPYFLLGISYLKINDTTQSFIYLEKAKNIDPNNAEIWFYLGIIHIQQNNNYEAIKSFESSISIDKFYKNSWIILAEVFHKMGEIHKSINTLENYSKIETKNEDCISKLGFYYKEAGLYDKWIEFLNYALTIFPNSFDINNYIGMAFYYTNNFSKAKYHFQQAQLLNPSYLNTKFASIFIEIPQIGDSYNHILLSRKKFFKSFLRFSNEFYKLDLNFIEDSAFSAQPFYLAYHELNNKKFLKKYGEAMFTLMDSWYKTKHFDQINSLSHSDIRVGIIGSHFKNHSVWHAITHGIIKSLINKNIRIYIFSLSSENTNQLELCKNSCFEVIQGVKNLSTWIQLIIERQLNFIIYPEIGMHQLTSQLATFRLANFQATSWGHPETTGFKNIDYFLSAELFETDNSHNHYSENLVKFKSIGTFYSKQKILPEFYYLDENIINKKIIISPGNIIKYSPEYDSIWIEILRNTQDSILLFFSNNKFHENVFLKRLSSYQQANEKELLDRIIFLPWLNPNNFYYILSKSCIYIDSVGFSGFNTAMQAIECGVPIVTLEGKFLRGKFASAILKRISLNLLVTNTSKDFIKLTSRLVCDDDFNANIRELIIRNREAVFNDEYFLNEFYEFIIDHFKYGHKTIISSITK